MATMLAATAQLHDRQIAAAQKSADRIVSLLEKASELKDRKTSNKLTQPLHKVTETLQDVTEPLHKITEPLQKVTEPLQKVTEPVGRFVGSREDHKEQMQSNARDWAEFRKEFGSRIRDAVKSGDTASKAGIVKPAAIKPAATKRPAAKPAAKKSTATKSTSASRTSAAKSA